MGIYDNTIHTLLATESHQSSEQTYFLSVYAPNPGQPQRELLRTLKSAIAEALRKHPFVTQFDDVIPLITDQALSVAEKHEELGKGIALFCAFDPTSRGRDFSLVQSQSVILSSAPKKEVSVGRTYDLDQLLWANALAYQALAINIERSCWKLFLHTPEDMALIQVEKNPYAAAERPEEHLNAHIGSQGGQIVHGTATEKFHHREKKENEQFLLDLADFIIEGRDSLPHFSYLVISHSEVFREYIGEFEKRVKTAFQNMTFLLIDKDLKEADQLHHASHELIQNHQHQQLLKVMTAAKENIHRYIEGWDQISQASREGRIRTLFIPAVPTGQEGYILDRSLPYLEKIEAAQPVRNVIPWIIKRTVETDGEVMITDGILQANDQPSAELRY